jgi:hypothetical protein
MASLGAMPPRTWRIQLVTCLNGGLFGVTNITFTLAERGQLPARFKQEVNASTRDLMNAKQLEYEYQAVSIKLIFQVSVRQ